MSLSVVMIPGDPSVAWSNPEILRFDQRLFYAVHSFYLLK